MSADNGNSYTFLQLLNSCEKIVIPKIQRDYAQGRKDPAGTNLCAEVRNNFVNSIKEALINNQETKDLLQENENIGDLKKYLMQINNIKVDFKPKNK